MAVADSLVNVINCYAFNQVSIAMQLQVTYHSLPEHFQNGILPISIHD